MNENNRCPITAPLAILLVLGMAISSHGGTTDTPNLLPGMYFYENDFDHPCEILEVGNSVAFRNEKGEWSWGTFDRATRRVEVNAGGGWGKIGGTVTDGDVIRWDSNVTWRRVTKNRAGRTGKNLVLQERKPM